MLPFCLIDSSYSLLGKNTSMTEHDDTAGILLYLSLISITAGETNLCCQKRAPVLNEGFISVKYLQLHLSGTSTDVIPKSIQSPPAGRCQGTHQLEGWSWNDGARGPSCLRDFFFLLSCLSLHLYFLSCLTHIAGLHSRLTEPCLSLTSPC